MEEQTSSSTVNLVGLCESTPIGMHKKNMFWPSIYFLCKCIHQWAVVRIFKLGRGNGDPNNGMGNDPLGIL